MCHTPCVYILYMCFVLEVQVFQDCGSVVPALSVPHDMQMLIIKHAVWQGLCTWHANLEY